MALCINGSKNEIINNGNMLSHLYTYKGVDRMQKYVNPGQEFSGVFLNICICGFLKPKQITHFLWHSCLLISMKCLLTTLPRRTRTTAPATRLHTHLVIERPSETAAYAPAPKALRHAT